MTRLIQGKRLALACCLGDVNCWTRLAEVQSPNDGQHDQ
jgi:hypothetical protein